MKVRNTCGLWGEGRPGENAWHVCGFFGGGEAGENA